MSNWPFWLMRIMSFYVEFPAATFLYSWQFNVRFLSFFFVIYLRGDKREFVYFVFCQTKSLIRILNIQCIFSFGMKLILQVMIKKERCIKNLFRLLFLNFTYKCLIQLIKIENFFVIKEIIDSLIIFFTCLKKQENLCQAKHKFL